MHKDLAKKNNLKVGDKIKLKSNLFDADNEKGADETVEVEIKGLFDGHNSGGDVYKRQQILMLLSNMQFLKVMMKLNYMVLPEDV